MDWRSAVRRFRRFGGRACKSTNGPAPALRWDWAEKLAQWVELGGDPEAFWRQTPRAWRAFVKGRSAAAADAHKARVWLAYHTALFQRVKTLPEFESLMASRAEKTEAMTPAQLERLSRRLARNGVGEIVEGK